jgi:hypothetical protein
MRTNRSGQWLVLFVLALLLTLLGVRAMEKMDGRDPKVPIRKLVVSFEQEQLDSFFEQIREFSQQNAFAIRIAPTSPTGKDFIIELWREDFKILGANPFDIGTFKFGIYNIFGREIDEEYVDEIVNELRVYSLKVKNATFDEE